MIGKKIVDILYPERCPLCGSVRPYGMYALCDSCGKALYSVEDPVCMCCGKPIEDEEREYCDDCMRIPKEFVRGFPVFIYEGKIKDSLYEFKYNNQRSYASFYGQHIIKKYGDEFNKLNLDGIVPVPIHKRKRRRRGYNQAELIASELGRLMGVKVYDEYIIRVVDTPPQKELNDHERMKNIKKAFKIGQNEVKLDKILLVDDIYTSGATINACTQVLLSAGSGEVYYTSVAVGRGYSQ